jgi:hypothetical protein
VQSGFGKLVVRLLTLATLAGGTAFGAGTMTLSVGATILSTNNCKFRTPGPTALAFGAIDPSSTGDATSAAGILFRCTGSAGTAIFSVTSDDGQYETGPGANRMRHDTNTGAFLRYTLDTPISGAVPRNTDQTLTVTGKIAALDFQNAIAGDYADSVVLTMAP